MTGHFTGIGLPEVAGWYVSSALYWVCGLALLLVERFSSSEMIHPLVGVMAIALLAGSPLLLIGARFAPAASWGPHARIVPPLLVLAVGATVVGDAIGPLVLLAIVPLLAVAFLHEWRIAVPYCVAAITYLVGAMLIHDSSPTQVARVIALAGTMSATALGLILAQRRQRRIAAMHHSLSVTDPLTGLANLRRLQSRLRQEVQRSTRGNHRVVMYAIDLDDFAAVNDRYSYQLGDTVLRAVASSLSDLMTPGDLLVRRGGDEFAVLTALRPDRELDRFGDDLQAAIASARHTVCPELTATASITRVTHESGESAEAFLRRVDAGLLTEKAEAGPEGGAENERASRNHSRRERVFSAGLEADSTVGSGKQQPLNSSARERSERTLAWRVAAAGASVAPIVLLVIVATGNIAELQSAAALALIGGMVICVVAALLAGQLGLRKRWAHVPLSISLILMTAVIAQAGDDAMVLVELYLVPTPLVLYLLGWRQAIPYAALSAVAYAYFLTGQGYRYDVLQIALFIGIMALLTVSLARGQRMTRQYLEAAEALSVEDPLTGAANLRGYERRVADEIERSQMLGEGMALAMIDLEGFKEVNDRYSHTIGDAVLVKTAAAIRSTVREDELVARRGGDEFVVVCAADAHPDLDALASRIADAIEQVRVELTPDLPAGATVVPVRWHFGESAVTLMRRADVALQDAKASRNQPTGDPSRHEIHAGSRGARH